MQQRKIIMWNMDEAQIAIGNRKIKSNEKLEDVFEEILA